MSNGKSTTTTGQVAPENLSKSVQAGMAMAFSFPQKIAETNLDTASELLTFISRRMKSQADFFRSLGHCSDLNSAVEMQRKFWEHVSSDYTREMGQLSEIATNNVNKVTKLVTESAPQNQAA